MSILASLARAYDRLPDAPKPGYSMEKIGFVIGLNADGSVANVTDLRQGDGKKKSPKMMQVPQPAKRTAAVVPNMLWDKTSYALGVTAGEGRRTAEEHAKFRQYHLQLLEQADDTGLLALRLFLDAWTADQFVSPQWPDEMKDQNTVFALESERKQGIYLHDRPAAKALVAKMAGGNETAPGAICLVSGLPGPIARLHPAIKNVWGGQSSGASIVSFNLDAFESYGHTQGDNAPISELSAFKYTAALNTFLAGKTNRIQIGDASTVFWADASDARAAETAESVFGNMFDIDEAAEAGKVGAILQRIRDGVMWQEAVRDIAPDMACGVRFHVLGLAPNAARISIRFWHEDDFGALAEHYRRFVTDMAIDPPPRGGYPPLWRYLNETAVQGKRENVQPNLAGEWMRAILAGTNYPLTLLNAVLTRIRADGRINDLRASIVKAVLIRNSKWSAKMALDQSNKDPAYLLGRLFAVLERFQELALGSLGASIRDRYYGSASAAPRTVFPMLLRLNLHHKSKAEKGTKAGLAHYFDGQMAEIMDGLGSDFPSSLSLHDQGKFALGYYHQFNRRKASEEVESTGENPAP